MGLMNKTMTKPVTPAVPVPHPVIPKMMKAAVMTGFGGREKLQTRLVPVPKVGPRDVLVHVVAAGLGSWDARLRRGDWREELAPPAILGADGAGVVVAKGARVRGIEVGDEVYGSRYLNPKGGFHAEYVCLPESDVALKPSKLTLEQAGAVAATALTAMQGIDHLKLNKDDVVLVLGAAGGVGTMAVQFAKAAGATVIATASGPGLEYVYTIGADAAFDARRDGRKGFEKALEAVDASSLDAILATAGGDFLQELIGRVHPRGKVAFPNGVEPEPKAEGGVDVIAYNGEPSRKAFDELTRRIEQMPYFDAHIARIFPLDQAADAHALMEAGGVIGKVLLQVDPMWPVVYSRKRAEAAMAAPRGARKHGRGRRR